MFRQVRQNALNFVHWYISLYITAVIVGFQSVRKSLL
jgi:hypothetical protein